MKTFQKRSYAFHFLIYRKKSQNVRTRKIIWSLFIILEMKELNYKKAKFLLNPIKLAVDKLDVEPRSFNFYWNKLLIFVSLSIYLKQK